MMVFLFYIAPHPQRTVSQQLLLIDDSDREFDS